MPPSLLRRISLLVSLSALLAAGPGNRSAQAEANPTTPARDDAGASAFGFLFGEWRVQHRVLKPDRQSWLEFEGTSHTRPLLGGSGNVEDNVFHKPGGVTRGVALRAFDPKSGQWAIWWLDGRDPHGTMDPPVKGRFENGVGTFYSDGEVNGKPTRTRFVWSHITPTSARWEQAYSTDAGATWETNWTMRFERTR